MTEFYIDIEDSNGNKLGSGPISSAPSWRYTARMDRAGSFAFTMPASDPKAAIVQKKRIARAYAQLGTAWVEVGAGIIDNIERQPGADGITWLRVSGDDLIRELSYRSVLNLKLYTGGNPVSHAAAVVAVGGYAPPGWSFTPDSSPANDSIYGYFNGETVLAGIVKIAEKSQNHFYRGTGRNITFASAFTPSGVRAIRATGNLVSETCAITAITERIDTYDLITRIYPRGSGNAEAQLTLRPTSRSAPPGFTLNATQNYIEHTTAAATYGRIERQLDFRDIGPIANTDADLQAAANMLFDAALETLRRQSSELEQATYTLGVAQCSQLLRPMQSIWVDYADPDAALNINQALNILEATWEVDSGGVRTTGLVVSNADRWPTSDVGAIVDSIASGHVYQALPQLNANAYTTGYTKNIDDTETAAIRFWFGAEVTQLQQVLLQFQLLAFESTVKAVGGASSGSGDVPTNGPSTNESGSGGNNDTGSGGGGSTGSTAGLTDSGGPTSTNSGGPTETLSSGATTTGATATTTDSGGPTATGSGGPTATGSGGPTATGSGGPTATGSTSGSTDATSLTADSGGGGSTGSSAGSTGGPSNNATGGPQGGDVVSAGRHSHGIGIGAYAGGGNAVYLIPNGSNSQLQANGATGTVPINVSGDHTHSLNSHNHSLNSHTHSISGHTHTLPNHTHSVGSHTHTVTAHTHSISAHTHTVAAHTHTVAAHTHSLSSHTHSVPAHTHTISAHTHGVVQHNHSIPSHTHTVAAHTHSLSSHTHSLNNHTHDLSESLTAIYGIFREEPAKTYGINDLEYRVNSGSWANLNTATNLGGGWYRLDITSQVQNSVTFRPLQENNTLELRRRAAAAAEKTVTVDALLSVRNIIQAIAYV